MALCRPGARCEMRGGVGGHRQAAEARVRRLIEQRREIGGLCVVPLCAVRAGVFDDEGIDCCHAAVLLESHLRPGLEAGTRAADVGLLFAGDPHHHRAAIELLREQGRDRHRLRARDLAAEPAARVLADDDDVARRDANPARDRRHGARHALRGAVQVKFAVLPVGHRRPRFERLVRGRLLIGRVFDDDGRLGEALLDIAPDGRDPGFRIGGEVAGHGARVLLRGPLNRLDLAADKHVAFRPAVRAARTQAIERIDGEVERREDDLNLFDRGRGQFLAVGGNGQDWFALAYAPLPARARPESAAVLPEPVALEARPRRSVASRVRRSHRGRPAEPHPRALAGRAGAPALIRHRRPRRWAALRRPGRTRGWGRRRQIVGRQHGMHTRHGEGAAGIDADDARVRSRAEHQLREQHPVGAKVLGVAGAAGDFGQQVLCRVVLANQLEPVRVDRREGAALGAAGAPGALGAPGAGAPGAGAPGAVGCGVRSAITPSSRALRRSSCSRGSCCSPRTGTDCRRCRAPARRGWGWDSS